MLNSFARPAALLAVLITTGCASAPRVEPGTGDVSFRLRWSGTADLDLHVEDPSGETLSYIQRQTQSGGLLDIDCNAGPEQICKHPIENVYWPEGAAPEGIYHYRVEFFRSVAGDAAHATYVGGREVANSKEALDRVSLRIPFELEVRLGEQVVATKAGEVTTETRVVGPFEYEFERP